MRRSDSALRVTRWVIGACPMWAGTTAALLIVAHASVGGDSIPQTTLRDSGWAYSSTPRIALSEGNVPVDRVLPPDALSALDLSGPKQDAGSLEWRPARPSLVPEAGKPPVASPEAAAEKPARAQGAVASPGAQAKPAQDNADKAETAGPELQGPLMFAPGRAASMPAEPQTPFIAPAEPELQEPVIVEDRQPAAGAAQDRQSDSAVEAPQVSRDLRDAFSRPFGSSRSAEDDAEDDAEEQSCGGTPRGEGDIDCDGGFSESSESDTKLPQTSPPRSQASKPSPLKAQEPAQPLQDGDPTPAAVVPKAVVAPQPAAPKAPLKPLSRSQAYLRSRVRSVLAHYYRKPLNTRDHDPWQTMHGMLSYELHSRLLDGGPTGSPITAIGYLCYNKPCKGKQLLTVGADGRLDVKVGVGLQGHKGQFLAMLAQCNVDPSYPIRVEDKEFTISDLIRSEQATCFARTELSFKLIALMHYLPSDTTWVNENGETWDIPMLIRDERTQKIRGAACGGTHRLMGLGLAVRKRQLRGEPMTGEWAEGARFIDSYQNYCFRLQNEDGSLSTEWFRGPGEEDDLDRRIRTTGHQTELLAATLPDDKLHYYRTVRAVSYLTNLLATNTDHAWEEGTLCHALHALVLYDKRVFQPYDTAAVAAKGAPTAPAAQQAPATGRSAAMHPARSTPQRSGASAYRGRTTYRAR